MAQLQVVMAQVNPVVGDIDGNIALVLEQLKTAESADKPLLYVFPELVLTGYPPEDLLLRPSIKPRIEAALAKLTQAPKDVYVLLGYPRMTETGLFNAAGLFKNGELLFEYHKQCLPNYRVFDEKRYFQAGQDDGLTEIEGFPVAISICEDIWQETPMAKSVAAGAKLQLNLNASPFRREKQKDREALLSQRAKQHGVPIAYCNLVGGQDELVFDGASMAFNAEGECVARAASFAEQQLAVNFVYENGSVSVQANSANLAEYPDSLAITYDALVVGVRDYVRKNGFKGVVLGLSGGIDSALTLAVAVDALGAECVEAVMMPFKYTSNMSLEDAEEEANTLGVKYSVISIESIYHSFMDALAPSFEGLDADLTEQNLQARARGVLLMAISNKKGYLVLTTGNKSEVAVGYSTLYGDMAGGFDVLKDVAKTLVYQLSSYRNTLGAAIPQRVIDRPPSAELAPDQKDEDNLPPYDVLDEILSLYVEQDYSEAMLVEAGFEAATVQRVIRLVDLNEYKRRQAPIGTRITQRGFGRDRRYPITNRWKSGV